ncbi:MAG: Mfa1 family fimbria major subunit [Bacteroides sp.]|nr:Mfa1 family fimbria major subunit [Bacteroides sp.]
MNNIYKFLSVVVAMALLASCSSDKLSEDVPQPVDPENYDDGFFMNLDIQMPSGNLGSRSETVEGGGSSAGTEIGSDAENAITSALIILAADDDVQGTSIKKNGFIAASEVLNNHIVDVSNASSSQSKVFRASAKIQKTNLLSYYNALGAITGNPKVRVYVFANPTAELSNMFVGNNVNFGDAEWVNTTCSVIQGSQTQQPLNIGIWGSNSFLMNNEAKAVRLLPASLIAWEPYNSYDKAFHLSDTNEGGIDNSVQGNGGAVRIERSVARLDFKDGSELGNNTYNVLYAFNNDGSIIESAPIVTVQLFKMAVVNMCNKFYYLPRVSDNGLASGANYELLGKEKPWIRDVNTGKYTTGNYVVGPYYDVFGNGSVKTGFSTYFNYPFFEDDGSFNNNTMAGDRWDVVKISDVLKGRDDNYKGDNSTEGGNYTPGTYKVWRYITENVIPVDPEKQVNGISTGIVFKAKLLGSSKVTSNNESYNEEYWDLGSNLNLANCLNGKPFIFNSVTHDKLTGSAQADPILYYFSGKLYLGWRHIRQAALQAAITINVSGDLEINRSNSLYRAVFGDGPVPDTYKYVKDEKGEDGKYVMVDIKDPLWETEKEEYKKSADYLWTVWNTGNENEDGRPVLGEDGETPASLTAFRQAAVDGGITIYQSSNDDADGGPGYYCYYYYWNRHNDNGIPGVMGPMEFDVVRNNVYKLSVDKISHLGHPRIPDNDPDDPKPDTPDESDLIYLDVRTLIVPWAVRINGIVF